MRISMDFQESIKNKRNKNKRPWINILIKIRHYRCRIIHKPVMTGFKGGNMRSLILRIVLILSFFCFYCSATAEDSLSAAGSAPAVNVSSEEVSSVSSDKTASDNKEEPVDDEIKLEIQAIRKSLHGTERKKVLVAYFSRIGENPGVGTISVGNTFIVAKEIARQTRGTLFEIRAEYEYPADYKQCLKVAEKEKAAKARPKLAETVDITPYDEIYIGSPVWLEDMPMPVYTFLESMDFSGKVIRPFNTHEGSGEAMFEDKIAAAAKNAEVKPMLSVRGAITQYESVKLPSAIKTWRTKEAIKRSQEIIDSLN